MPLNELIGIEKREKNDNPESQLEKLLEIGEDVVKKFGKSELADRITYDNRFEPISKLREKIEIYCMRSIENIEYTEKDIESFVNGRLGVSRDTGEQVTIGTYSGIILDILTMKNREKAKGTRIAIDGKGEEFDYLFSCAKNFDEVYVSNIKGDYICTYAGAEGYGKMIVLNDIKGDYIGKSIAALRGNVEIAVINRAEGLGTGHEIASYHGNAGLIIVNNAIGRETLMDVAVEGGSIGLALINKAIGDYTAWCAAYDSGSIGDLVITNSKTKSEKGFDIDVTRIKNILLKMNKFNFSNKTGKGMLIGNNEDMEKSFNEDYRINELSDAVKKIVKKKEIEGIIKQAGKIQSIYETIKERVEGDLAWIKEHSEI
ncbi:MAG: hypothetical protein NTV63_04815 [Candidatus Woesearchaeota archaeon]|nr:hypothetical protein [Candidatus Woesearchaeota archaeon]